MTSEEYWLNFLQKKELPQSTPYGGELGFDTMSENSTELLALILCGKKTAFFSALPAFEIDAEPLPKIGLYYVLCDSLDQPKGIIKTENVSILPYSAVTWEMAKKEGEDSSMLEWTARRDEFFEDDADFMGYDFGPNMPVVFEEFRLQSFE